ncbi:MAG: YsnF/AvaK domain-containing protein [Chloroflexi bacterium]|nr:YsnF/AvaK domain-containing protein [Chloroflexota bacterium]
MDGSTVVGVFDNRGESQQCVDELHRAGFSDDQIGWTTRGEQGGGTMEGTANHAGEGAGAGLLTGAGIGAAAGAVLTGLIPGIGPFLAGGILAGVLGGAAAGAAAGGLIGALTGMGVPKEEAEYYNREFEAGHTVVTVRADSRYAEAQAIMDRFHARRAGTGLGSSHATTASSVQLREEQLQARTTQVQSGEVEIGKRVVTEEQTMNVPVTHEEIQIERHPVNRPASGTIDDTANETLRVPLTEERVEVEKRPVVTEEINVTKTPVTENQQVTETVRREEAEVHNAPATGATCQHSWVADRCSICGAARR